jgi:hypothetical protein
MKPPVWLVVATGALAVSCLVLAIAETNLWAHYLIGQGRVLGLLGLGFILIAGLYLFRRHSLMVSLPLVFPWLLYPVITQGDQIIDNFSINPMRIICQVLLAAIFAMPVVAVVLAARYALPPKPGAPILRRRWTAWFPGLRPLAEGRIREGTGLLAAALMVAEIWVADCFLGKLMVATLVGMILVTLVYASLTTSPSISRLAAAGGQGERVAVVVLVAGVAASLGVHFYFQDRPGAYQGSPSTFMDPSQKDKRYPIDRIATPSRAPSLPASAQSVQDALTEYGRTFQRLLDGYHILDRNYTYDFHNHLFLRYTPLVANYRAVALQKVEEARRLAVEADALGAAARAQLPADDPLAALLDEMRAYAAYNFDRAPVLERLSAGFERTPAGLQHAAHLYEGECKELGTRLMDILVKHHAVLDSPATAPVTRQFALMSQAVYAAYAEHVVGF